MKRKFSLPIALTLLWLCAVQAANMTFYGSDDIFEREERALEWGIIGGWCLKWCIPLAKGLGISAKAAYRCISDERVTIWDEREGLCKGCEFVSTVQGCPVFKGEVISMYFHPSRDHTATTVGTKGTVTSKVAKAGTWAISRQRRKWRGNKAYYRTL